MLENGARDIKLFRTDISDWRITFVDTGLNSPIGERLRRVRRFVEGEEMFLANYADVFTAAPLPDMIARFAASNAVASLLAVPPQSSHHVVDVGDDGMVTQVTPMRDLRQWENGGYFLLRPEIFDHLNEGEDLVEDVLVRDWSRSGRVLAYPYKGYWSPADTVKERAQLEEMYYRGELPLDDLGPGTIRCAHRPRLPRPADGGVDRPCCRLRLAAPSGQARCLCSRSARTQTTSRSAPAALLLSPRRKPAAGALRGADRDCRTPAGGAQRRRALSCQVPTSPLYCTICRRDDCRRSGAQ